MSHVTLRISDNTVHMSHVTLRISDNPVHMSHVTFNLLTKPLTFTLLFHNSNNIRWQVQFMKLYIMQFYPISYYFQL